MTKKAKITLIAALAMTRLAATPAFGQSFNGSYETGNVLPFTYQSTASNAAVRRAGARAARGNGMNSFAMEPRAQSDSNSNRYNASRVPPFDYRGTSDYPWGPGYNFPYPNRPYGDPDQW
jgi:hypothetical protein